MGGLLLVTLGSSESSGNNLLLNIKGHHECHLLILNRAAGAIGENHLILNESRRLSGTVSQLSMSVLEEKNGIRRSLALLEISEWLKNYSWGFFRL